MTVRLLHLIGLTRATFQSEISSGCDLTHRGRIFQLILDPIMVRGPDFENLLQQFIANSFNRPLPTLRVHRNITYNLISLQSSV